MIDDDEFDVEMVVEIGTSGAARCVECGQTDVNAAMLRENHECNGD